MKLNIKSYTINKQPAAPSKTVSLTNTKKHIFIGREDGKIDILNTKDLTLLFTFKSHTKSFDILQNTEISEAVQCIQIYENGHNYTTLLCLNENLLKVWNLNISSYSLFAPNLQYSNFFDEAEKAPISHNSEKPRFLQNTPSFTIPNFFQYTANSLNINEEYILASDFLTIKYVSMHNLFNPIILINNKPKNLSYETPLNLINQSNFIDSNQFIYCTTNGTIYLNDLRTKIQSENIQTFDHKKNLIKSKHSDLLHSISDFTVFTNLLYARNLNSVISFDIRKGFIERKTLIDENTLFAKNSKMAYDRYSIDVFNGKVVTGMLNTINIIDHEHHVVKLPVGGTNLFLKSLGGSQFCSFYSGKLLFFKLK
ncbi:Protein phosphatase PP2A 55 kDa regulatory subunit [Cucumispora dikerogammari]|nr:Protein phosphatase PP2A 55 kDa regulatory subunit [Cucumispora dikerogammari]